MNKKQIIKESGKQVLETMDDHGTDTVYAVSNGHLYLPRNKGAADEYAREHGLTVYAIGRTDLTAKAPAKETGTPADPPADDLDWDLVDATAGAIKLMKEQSINPKDITGTLDGGRIGKNDVDAYLAAKNGGE